MRNIRILPKKCATFRVKDGNDTLEHEIKPADRMILQDAPGWIQDDPLFGWMIRDGSMEMVETVADAASQRAEESPHTPVDVQTLSEEQPQEDEPKKRGRRTT